MTARWKLTNRGCKPGRKWWMLERAGSDWYATVERGEASGWWYWYVYRGGADGGGQAVSCKAAKEAAESAMKHGLP